MITGSADVLSARNKTPFWQGSELRLSWGYLPIDATVFSSWEPVDPTLTIGQYLDKTQYYGGYGRVSGAVNLAYAYRFRRWFELSGILTYSGYYRNYYDKITEKLAFRENTHSISVMPYAKFVWLYRKYVRMYSGIGLGLSIVVDKGEDYMDTGVLPAFSLTPIGIAVGADVYGFADLSVGTIGCINVGLGYRF